MYRKEHGNKTEKPPLAQRPPRGRRQVAATQRATPLATSLSTRFTWPALGLTVEGDNLARRSLGAEVEDPVLLVTHGQDLTSSVGTVDPLVREVTCLDPPFVHVLGLVHDVHDPEPAHDEKRRERNPPRKDEKKAERRRTVGRIVVKAHLVIHPPHTLEFLKPLYLPDTSGFRRLISLRVAKLLP